MDSESRTRQKLAASAAQLRRWAHEPDLRAATEAMREGRRRKLENEVDPERRLPEHERARRADQLQRAHMREIAAKSAAVRARRKASKDR